MRIVIDDAELFGEKCDVVAIVKGDKATVAVALRDGPTFTRTHELVLAESHSIAQAVAQLVTTSPAVLDLRQHQVDRQVKAGHVPRIVRAAFLGPRAD